MLNDDLLTRIRHLETTSGCLEPDKLELDKWVAQLSEFSNTFLDHIETSLAVRKNDYPELKSIFNINTKSTLPDSINTFIKYILNNGIDTASSRYLGFIPGGGIPLSAVADYIAALTNCYAGNIITAPGAVEMERAMIKWMSHLVGFPDTASGNLTSGGSYASLIAMVTAREAFSIKAKNIDKTVIYLSVHTHHSILKCLRTIGMGEAIIRHIPVDNQFKMVASNLNDTINADKQQGLNPFLIVASAGTTDTGSIDPIDDISAIAKQHQLWLHVDAAYGGFFILTDAGKNKLQAMSHADSITLDPHKGLFLPYGIGAVLIKDSSLQKRAFSSSANYMQDVITTPDEWSPSDMSPELTKHFRALRMWLPLTCYGVEPFCAALEEKLLLTEFLYQELQSLPDIEIACKPELSIIAFRYVPDAADANEINKRLLATINADKRIFLSSTRLDSRYFIRVACLSFRTHLNDMKLTLEIIKNAISTLQVSA